MNYDNLYNKIYNSILLFICHIFIYSSIYLLIYEIIRFIKTGVFILTDVLSQIIFYFILLIFVNIFSYIFFIVILNFKNNVKIFNCYVISITLNEIIYSIIQILDSDYSLELGNTEINRFFIFLPSLLISIFLNKLIFKNNPWIHPPKTK